MVTVTQPKQRRYLPKPRLLTRQEFQEIADSGVFGPEERLELIEGVIYPKELPVNTPHVIGVRRCETQMQRIFSEGYDVRGQMPLALNIGNEPLPDVTVVTGSFDDYLDSHPTTALIVIEISDTTLRFDTTTKASLYARAGIQDYWVVNLVNRVLIVHRQPGAMRGRPLGHGYQSVVEYSETESVSPLAAPDAIVAVADLLPLRREN